MGANADQAGSNQHTPAVGDDLRASVTGLAAAWNHDATAFLRRNATVAAAACAFGIVVFKILAVAQFNPRVAAALIGSADSPAVALDVAIYVAPFVFALVCLVVVALAIEPRSERKEISAVLRGAAIVAVPLLVVAAPLSFLLLMALPLVLLGAWNEVHRRLPAWTRKGVLRTRSTGARTSAVEWGFVFGIPLLLVAVSPPWMPAERVGLGPSEVVVAYVVRTDGNWTVLLIDQGKSLRYVPTSEISSREPCSTEKNASTVLELLNGSQLPQCYP